MATASARISAKIVVPKPCSLAVRYGAAGHVAVNRIVRAATSASSSRTVTRVPGRSPSPVQRPRMARIFRTGGLARLGFDDAELARLNPALVHLAISGYGPDGPAADRPGYDFVIQAASGLMSITGAADAEGGEPTKVGVAISDVVSGMLGAVSVLAALVGRERAGQGAAGQRIDVSLLGSTLASLVNQAQNAFVRGTAPGRQGNAHPNIVPYETFRTADGEIAVAVGSERQWPRFCDALGLPALAD